MARSTVCEHCGLLFRRRGAQAATARWCSLACRAARTDALVVGKTFGELTCLGRAGDYKWECLCACGATVYRNAFALLGGKSKCCGCKISQRASERTRPDLSGHRYGRWTVLRWSHIDKGSSYWTCRCSCGTVSKLPAKKLEARPEQVVRVPRAGCVCGSCPCRAATRPERQCIREAAAPSGVHGLAKHATALRLPIGQVVRQLRRPRRTCLREVAVVRGVHRGHGATPSAYDA